MRQIPISSIWCHLWETIELRFSQASSSKHMDTSTSLPPTDPTVMAQQIQALTANMQELMKQNEELK